MIKICSTIMKCLSFNMHIGGRQNLVGKGQDMKMYFASFSILLEGLNVIKVNE